MMKSVLYHTPRWFAAAAIFAAVFGAPGAAACKLCDAAAAKNLGEVRKLLDGGENPNSGEKKGKPPIIHAAESNNVEIVRLMLDRGANANARDKGDETGVFSAAWRGNAEIAQLLIDGGASFDHANKSGSAPLHLAAFKDRPTVVSVLAAAGANLNRKNGDKKTALFVAVENNNTNAVRALVLAGADVNVLYAKNNETALHAAAWRGNNEIVKLLVDGGADFSVRNKKGETALAIANKRRHRESARILQSADKCLLCDAARSDNRAEARRLIAAGADVNKLDHHNANWGGGQGLTSLHRAAQHGHAEMIKILLDAGARTDIAANRFGSRFYPLTYALWHNRGDAVIALLDGGADANLVVRSAGIEEPAIVAMARLGNVDVVKKLLEKGANPNVRGYRGNSLRNSPLIWAVDKNNAELVKVLLKHNADPAMQGGYGGTPILAAVKKKNGGIVDMFLRKSPAAAAQALVHFAGVSDNNEYLKFLLDRGANPDTADAAQGGKTALMAAAENDHMENVILLMNRGASPDRTDNDGNTAWDIVANKLLIKSVMQDIVGRQYGVSIDGRRAVGTPTSTRPCTDTEIIKNGLCIPCGNNTEPNEAKTECVIHCPAGQFGGTGRWNPHGERHASCTQCPAGTVAPAGDAKTCTKCTATEKPNADRSACIFGCDENQIAERGQCVSCGNNSEPNQAKTHCLITCPAGRFGRIGDWNPNGKVHIVCHQCPANKVRLPGTAQTCTSCPAGKRPNAARSACVS